MSIMTSTEVEDVFDYRDSNLWWRHRSKGRQFGKPAGGYNPEGYRSIKFDGVSYWAHRLIWLLHHPDWDMTFTRQNTIDHIDGRPWNNDISNLRLATQNEQMQNAVTPINNTSGHKGVSWDKTACKWAVKVHFNGIAYYGGHFDEDELDIAVAQATLMRNHYHGKFAKHG